MSQLLRETAVPEGDTALLDPPLIDTETDGLDVAVLPRPRPAEGEGAQPNNIDNDQQDAVGDGKQLWRPDDDLRAECINIAIRLSELPDIGDRIDVYNRAGVSKLSRAAALAPDLMPLLNNEFEWIALTSADAEP